MSAPLAPGIDICRIGAVEVMHHPAQVALRRFQHQVIMVAHQHVPMQKTAKSLSRDSQVLLESLIIALGKKDLLPLVATCRHMIDGPLEFNAQWPRHNSPPKKSIKEQIMTAVRQKYSC